MEITKKMLKAAAVELNEVLGLSPEINPKSSDEEITKGIKSAIKLVNEDDEFTENTQAVIASLTVKETKTSAKGGKKVPVPAPVEEEEEEEEEVEEEAEEVEEEAEEEVPASTPKSKKSEKTAPVKESKKPEGKPGKKVEKETAPAVKKGKVTVDKTNSPTYVVRFAVCKNPAITDKELLSLLEKKGLEMAPISVSLRKNEMLAAIAILKEQGQL